MKQALADKEQAFTRLPVPQALARFIVPTVLSQLAFLLLNLADAFFVGRTGDMYQVSAMTITFPVIMMMNCVTTIFATGGNATIAAALGGGNRPRASQAAVFSIYTAMAVVLFYSLTVGLFQQPVFRLLGASDQSIGFCKEYLFWALIGSSIPFTFNQVISQLFLAEGESRIAGFGITMAGIINIILDPIFVFPLGMGVAGAGAATCLSNWVVFFYYLYQHVKRRHSTTVDLNIRHYRPERSVAFAVLSVGVPAGLVLFLTNICDFVRNYYLGSLGSDVELAAWGAVQKISNALMMITVGIAQGVRPLLAYNFASRHYQRARSLTRGAFGVMLCYIAVALTFVHLFPEPIIRLFVTAPEAVDVAIFFLTRWTFAIIGIGALELFNAIFQAFGRWKISLANIVIDKGLLLTPVLVLLVRLLGIEGIAYSQILTENLTAAVLAIVYLRMARRLGNHPCAQTPSRS